MLIRSIAVVVAIPWFINPVACCAQTTNNPINGSAPIAHWSFLLEDVATIPNGRAEFLTHNPANGQAYVLNQQGSIFTFDPAASSPAVNTYLNFATTVGNLVSGGESGVRGLAFHPDVDNPGSDGYRKMYTTISRTSSSASVGNPVVFGSPGSTDHYTVLGEWTLNADYSVNTSSYRELIRIEQPFGNHNSGHIGFDPTAAPASSDYGKLYLAVGDGGSSGGPFDLSQDIDATPAPYPHGKILRIDPIASGSDPYTIPSDNPFAGRADRVEETWAYGFRNAHKFDWDPLTGVMYISDIGQNVVEEISIGHLGGNYGWNDREGSYVYSGSNVAPLPADHATDQYTYPVAQYDHNGSNGISGSSAIVGGTVYRGTQVPELTGMYLFAEFASNPGPIFAVDADDLVERDDFSNVTALNNGRLSPYVEVEIRDGAVDKDFRQFLRDANNNQSIGRTDLRWGVGPDGEIYVLSKQDPTIRRIAGIVGLAQGDADRNNIVDGHDLASWLDAFGETGDWSDGNFDASALVDGRDFLTWQRNTGGSPAIASVPEPSTLLLLASAAFISAFRRHSP